MDHLAPILIHHGPHGFWKWPKLGHLGHFLAQESSLEPFFFKQPLNKQLHESFCTHFDPAGTTWGPEMAKTWPSGAPTASDIDFRTKFTKATLIPNKKQCLEFSLDHLGPHWGRQWLKLGHLDHPQIFIKILLNQH